MKPEKKGFTMHSMSIKGECGHWNTLGATVCETCGEPLFKFQMDVTDEDKKLKI